MLSLPEEHELIGLFACEPELLDGKDKPWVYNELRFTTIRGNDEVIVTIYPSFGEFTIAWSRNGVSILKMKLIELDSIIVQPQYNDEFLAASGSWNTHSMLVKLRLKPQVAVELEQSRAE